MHFHIAVVTLIDIVRKLSYSRQNLFRRSLEGFRVLHKDRILSSFPPKKEFHGKGAHDGDDVLNICKCNDLYLITRLNYLQLILSS